MITTAPTTTRPSTAARRARIATVGAVLLIASPLVWWVAELGEQDFGSLQFLAVAAWWIFVVLPPALLVPGHMALRGALGPDAGRVGTTGVVLAAAGLGAMSLGIGIEVASMSVGGGEVPLGHVILLVGWLVAVLGALLTGITVFRRRSDGVARAAGVLLVLAVPVGLGVGAVGSAVGPRTDAFFWAALTLPIAVAWLLLARSLSNDAGSGS